MLKLNIHCIVADEAGNSALIRLTRLTCMGEGFCSTPQTNNVDRNRERAFARFIKQRTSEDEQYRYNRFIDVFAKSYGYSKRCPCILRKLCHLKVNNSRKMKFNLTRETREV